MELHEAAFYGLTERVQLLLQQKALVNSVDKVYMYMLYNGGELSTGYIYTSGLF